jgi:mannosyltransferase OCH1-like enzyme
MSIKSLFLPKLNQPTDREILAPEPEGHSIPKIIHQTFYDRKLPPELQSSVAALRALNPGWEYRFYDDNDIAVFIQGNYPPEVWRYFERIDKRYGAARADLFRYLLMYKVGGVYLDIKSAAVQPLDSGLRVDDKFLLSKWVTADGAFAWGNHEELRHIAGGEYQQWYIACASGHPFLKAVVESVLSNIDAYDPVLHGVGKYGVLRVTGPVAYTLAIERIRSSAVFRIADSERELGLNYNVFSGQSHQTTFKSHYSLQSAPLVRQGMLKRQMTRIYTLMQRAYHLTKRLKPVRDRNSR